MSSTSQYRDYAESMPAAEGGEVQILDNSSSRRIFPVVLHDMLHQIEHENMSHIVGWQAHGRCFKVRKQEQFVEHILPQ